MDYGRYRSSSPNGRSSISHSCQEAILEIITERDIVCKVIRERGDVPKIRAQEIMSSPLVEIDADKSVAKALELMRDKKQEIRRLAVTRQGRLVGIVTERRLLDTLI